MRKHCHLPSPHNQESPSDHWENVLSTAQSTPKNPSFFSPVQACVCVWGGGVCATCLRHHNHPSAKCEGAMLWDGSPSTTRKNNQGRLVMVDGSKSTLTGKFRKNVPLQAIPSNTGALGVGKWVMEPSSTLMQRRLKPLSLYCYNWTPHFFFFSLLTCHVIIM